MKYAVFLFGMISFFVFSNVVFAPGSGDRLPATVLITGDIMLGRTVETISLSHGFEYPFVFAKEIFSSADTVFANLEGPIPSVHAKTPPYSFRFSFSSSSIRALRSAGVNAVTLANNHTVDFGEEGYNDTVSELKRQGIAWMGHPTRMDENLTFAESIRRHELRFVGLNDTYAPVDIEKAAELIRGLKKNNNVFVIVAVHWGEEYKNVSNQRQQVLGHALIDAGADVVVGHHPHVVEEIEMYRGKPIFYSLGNFIFDQYFSEETQKGFALRVIIGDINVSYEVIPVDLHGSQPKKMDEEESKKFFSELAKRSVGEIARRISEGEKVSVSFQSPERPVGI